MEKITDEKEKKVNKSDLTELLLFFNMDLNVSDD